MERDTPVVEIALIEGASNSQGTQHPIPDVNTESSSHLEDDRLIVRARAVGVDYEFAKPGEVETDDDRRKRQPRNQRRISEQEKRLREVVGDLPPPPPAGSSQKEDSAYSAVPEILSNMSDAEQMLIARLAPTVHVHLLKHGGIASKGHCIAFPQAVQEPATILPRLPAEVDIIRVRRQGKDDTHKDFRVRRHRVEGALRWLKDNNPAYGDVYIDGARIENLPEDGELPNLKTVEFSETERIDDQGPAPQ